MPMMIPYPMMGGGGYAPRERRASRRSSGSSKKYQKKYKRLSGKISEFKKKWKSSYGKGTEPNQWFYGSDSAHANEIQKAARKAFSYKGDGDYSLGWGSKNTGLGAGMRSGGRAIGNMFGMGNLGQDLGGHLSKFIGWGDYGPTSTNQIIHDGAHDGSQQVISVNAGDDLSGDITIRHTEFVQNITVQASGAGNTGFSLQSFAINPALSELFPFLSQLAQNFTLYEFQGLMVQYKPTSGEFGSAGSNSLGKVIFATNYDPDAATFTSSQQMENYDYANSTKPSCGMVHGIETKPSSRATLQMYTRTGTSTKDKVFTDLGLFQVATEGIYANAAGNQVIGELWVTYTCKLSRKNLFASLGNGAPYRSDQFTYTLATNVYTSTSSSINSNAAVSSTLSPWQNVVSAVSPGAVGGFVAAAQPALFTYYFPQNIVNGVYAVTISTYNSVATANGTITCTNVLGTTVVSAQGSYIVTAAVATATNTTASSQFLISVNAPGSVQAAVRFGLSGSNLLNNADVQINIVQVPIAAYNN